MNVVRTAEAGHRRARAVDQPPVAARVAAALHRLEHRARGVLQRDVEVGHAAAARRAISVEHRPRRASPGRRRGSGSTAPSCRRAAPRAAGAGRSAEAEVLAVAGGVLGDEDQLADAELLEAPRLGDQRLHRARPEAPAHRRDVAERARVVAPLRDLEVGEHAAGGEQARRGVVVEARARRAGRGRARGRVARARPRARAASSSRPMNASISGISALELARRSAAPCSRRPPGASASRRPCAPPPRGWSRSTHAWRRR